MDKILMLVKKLTKLRSCFDHYFYVYDFLVICFFPLALLLYKFNNF